MIYNKLELKAGCMAWLEDVWGRCPLPERNLFLNLDEDDIVQYNSTLCREMRNDNLLWTYRDIIGHPDDFSMSVLYDFWREKNEL